MIFLNWNKQLTDTTKTILLLFHQPIDSNYKYA